MDPVLTVAFIVLHKVSLQNNVQFLSVNPILAKLFPSGRVLTTDKVLEEALRFLLIGGEKGVSLLSVVEPHCK